MQFLFLRMFECFWHFVMYVVMLCECHRYFVFDDWDRCSAQAQVRLSSARSLRSSGVTKTGTQGTPHFDRKCSSKGTICTTNERSLSETEFNNTKQLAIVPLLPPTLLHATLHLDLWIQCPSTKAANTNRIVVTRRRTQKSQFSRHRNLGFRTVPAQWKGHLLICSQSVRFHRAADCCVHSLHENRWLRTLLG